MKGLISTLLRHHRETGPVFAVLDGAQFANLPAELREGTFVSRSLYIDRGENNPEQVVTAPHMVWLDETPEKPAGRAPDQTVPALLELIGDRPAAVFWECSTGADALFRHLRGINMVMYPKAFLPEKADETEEATEDGAEGDNTTAPKEDETHRMVLFRHADANAISQVLPAMTAEETARLLGPATTLMFKPHPDWADGDDRLTLSRADKSVRAPGGPLRLSEETVERIGGARHRRRNRRISAYLRKVAPEQTEDMNDDALDKQVVEHTAEAEEYGVRSEAGLGRWCYLQILTGGKMKKDPNVHRLMTTKEPGVSPDQRVRLLLQQSTAEVREKKS